MSDQLQTRKNFFSDLRHKSLDLIIGKGRRQAFNCSESILNNFEMQDSKDQKYILKTRARLIKIAFTNPKKGNFNFFARLKLNSLEQIFDTHSWGNIHELIRWFDGVVGFDNYLIVDFKDIPNRKIWKLLPRAIEKGLIEEEEKLAEERKKRENEGSW